MHSSLLLAVFGFSLAAFATPAAPIGFTVKPQNGGAAASGFAQFPGQPAGGEAGGAIGVGGAHGHAAGSLGPAQGSFGGGAGPTGVEGCGKGGFGGAAFTDCAPNPFPTKPPNRN